MTMATREPRLGRGLWPEWMESPWGLLRMFGAPSIRVEDYMQDGEYVIRAEIPGVNAKDIDVSVAHGMLKIKAERRAERREPHRSEFEYGTFERVVTLPEGAKEDQISARYENGILEVTVEVERKQPEAHHIEVAAGGERRA